MVKKAVKKNLTAAKKEEIRNRFVQGIEDNRGGRKLYTLDELAADYGIPVSTLYKHSQKDDWVLQQKRFQDKYLADLDEKRRQELVNESVAFDKSSLQLAKGLMGRIAQELRSSQDDEDVKASHLQQLASALQLSQKVGKLALGQASENINVGTSSQDTETFREAMELLDQLAESRRKGDTEAVH